MLATVSGGRATPIGREPELALLVDFLEGRAARGRARRPGRAGAGGARDLARIAERASGARRRGPLRGRGRRRAVARPRLPPRRWRSRRGGSSGAAVGSCSPRPAAPRRSCRRSAARSMARRRPAQPRSDAPPPLGAARAEPVAAPSAPARRGHARQPAVRARGRAHAGRAGASATGEELPVPDAVEDLLGVRVAGLPTRAAAPARRRPERRPAGRPAGVADRRRPVDDAVDAGVLVVDGERVRASHPLLAAAARKHSSPERSRQLHLELADVVVDEELRARHLALATDESDAELAATVAAAATAASFRGARARSGRARRARAAPDAAGVGRAQRRVWSSSPSTSRWRASAQRVTDLLSAKLDSLPPGALRVRA